MVSLAVPIYVIRKQANNSNMMKVSAVSGRTNQVAAVLSQGTVAVYRYRRDADDYVTLVNSLINRKLGG